MSGCTHKDPIFVLHKETAKGSHKDAQGTHKDLHKAKITHKEPAQGSTRKDRTRIAKRLHKDLHKEMLHKDFS